MTKKQEGCEYCRGLAHLISRSNDSLYVFVDGENLRLQYNLAEALFGASVKRINYCPMCGRSLSEEERR